MTEFVWKSDGHANAKRFRGMQNQEHQNSPEHRVGTPRSTGKSL